MEEFYWLKLSRIRGVKNETIKMLVKSLTDPLDILKKIESLKSKNIAQDISIPEDESIKAELQAIKNFGAEVIHYNHPYYPKLLQEIPAPPMALTVKGNTKILSNHAFSIIGTRTPSINSIQFAKYITEGVGKNFTIVSGLAAGIDSAVHSICLEKKINTVGVIGCGINVVYPSENKSLYAKMFESENSAIISEFNFSTAPIQYNFPQRNKIIAGMSNGLIVVEAKKNSGSIITARYAEAYNREIYSCPGFAMDFRYAGSNSLIKNNLAKLIESADDVYADFAYLFNKQCVKPNKPSFNKSFDFNKQDVQKNEEEIQDITFDLDEVKTKVLSLFTDAPITLEEIEAHLDFDISIIRGIIAELEIEEKLRRTADSKIYKVF